MVKKKLKSRQRSLWNNKLVIQKWNQNFKSNFLANWVSAAVNKQDDKIRGVVFNSSRLEFSKNQFHTHGTIHGLRTPGKENAFIAGPKIHSHSQIFRYGRSIFFQPHWPKFSDFFNSCLHWVSVVRGTINIYREKLMRSSVMAQDFKYYLVWVAWF